MQEFAPIKKAHPTGDCPGAEALAAYIDGNLEGAEKERIMEHLASCEDCFETYAESVRFLLDSEPEPGTVVRFPTDRKRIAPWWYAAAALLALGVGLGWYAFQSALVGSAPTLQVAEVSPNIQGPSVQELTWSYARFRGGEECEADLDRQSFQVGALLVDFHLSARAGDVRNSPDTWRTIGCVVKAVLSMGEEGDRILREANGIESGKLPLQAVAAKAAATEADLGDSVLLPEYLSFGKWTEAGRIAAKTGDRAFFESRENRRFLAYALRNREIKPNKEVRRELQEIARIWDQGDLESKDFKSLAKHFQAILDQYNFLP
jgi:hypothetical protein